jgi:hypothetical protein
MQRGEHPAIVFNIQTAHLSSQHPQLHSFRYNLGRCLPLGHQNRVN